MKILAVHKFFHPRGGAETAFFNTVELLRSRGHAVVPFAMSRPGNLPTPFAGDFVSRVEFDGQRSGREAVRAALRMLYSFEARRRIGVVVRRERPDIAHIHNIYHHLTPSILPPLAAAGVPAVQTLHDYKIVCPSYTLLAGGRPCEDCRQGRFLSAVRRRCGGGLAGGLLIAAEAVLHRGLLRSYDRIALFLSPSRFLRDKVREMGFPGRIRIVPNPFFPARVRALSGAEPGRVLYLGRLSGEKGLGTLLRAAAGWKGTVRLAGAGPLEAELRRIVRREGLGNVAFAGRLGPEALQEEIRLSSAIVLPSEWYENAPYAVLEAFAAARPVIASKIGGLPEFVREGETGWTFEAGSAAALRERLEAAGADPGLCGEMGLRARAFVLEAFDPEKTGRRLAAAYGEAIEGRPGLRE